MDSLAKSLQDKKGEFYSFETDVCKEEDIIKAFVWVKGNVGPVHVLVNNAGITRPTDILDFKTEDARDIFNTNVLGLTIASREAVRAFKENNINGHIININSIAGHWIFDVPTVSFYTASKYAVTALTESLYLELKRSKLGTKVTVSILLKSS